MNTTPGKGEDNMIFEQSEQDNHTHQNNSSTSGLESGNQKVNNNQFESNKNYFTICVYALFVIAIGAFIVYLILNMNQTQAMISNFISILSPFLIAIFIAFLLNPMVKNINVFLDKRIKIKKPIVRVFISIFVSYLVVIGVVIVTILYVTPQLINSITDLTVNYKYDDLYKLLNNLEADFPGLDFNIINNMVTNLIPEIISSGTDLLRNMIPALYAFSVSLIKLLVNILLSIVISCYMLIDKKSLNNNAMRLTYALLSKEKAQNFIQTAKECNLIFSKFIIGKSIDSLIIGILCFVAMNMLRIPYALLFSVIVGLTNMIPYFGPFIGAVPGIVILLLLNPVKSLIFAILILILQQFDGLYLGPKILGESTGLKPLWVIFAIILGGAYWGLLGMFLGVPTIAVVAHLLNKFINKRLAKKNII